MKYIAFPLQQWLLERALLLRYTLYVVRTLPVLSFLKCDVTVRRPPLYKIPVNKKSAHTSSGVCTVHCAFFHSTMLYSCSTSSIRKWKHTDLHAKCRTVHNKEFCDYLLTDLFRLSALWQWHQWWYERLHLGHAAGFALRIWQPLNSPKFPRL